MLRLKTPSPTQLSRWRRTAVAVDEVSRLIFPLGFLVFTASYWFYFYFSVGVDQVTAPFFYGLNRRARRVGLILVNWYLRCSAQCIVVNRISCIMIIIISFSLLWYLPHIYRHPLYWANILNRKFSSRNFKHTQSYSWSVSVPFSASHQPPASDRDYWYLH